MWSKWEVLDTPQLREPALIVGMSTSNPSYVMLYSHARELANYLLEHMEFKLFARLYSDAFPPEVTISQDGIARPHSGDFYYYRGDKKDLLLLTSSSSPIGNNYAFAEEVLNFAKALGSNHIYSIGARFMEPPSTTAWNEVLGYATHSEGVELLKRHGIRIIRDEPSPYFSSVIVGMAKLQGMMGYRLAVNHGEPRPHLRSVSALLKALSKLLEFEVDTRELDLKASRLSPTAMNEERRSPPPDEEIYR